MLPGTLVHKFSRILPLSVARNSGAQLFKNILLTVCMLPRVLVHKFSRKILPAVYVGRFTTDAQLFTISFTIGF
jgi:hypothetical protein